jgi:hypothetical protein
MANVSMPLDVKGMVKPYGEAGRVDMGDPDATA